LILLGMRFTMSVLGRTAEEVPSDAMRRRRDAGNEGRKRGF
jgi:hypothetical protein